MQKPPKSRHMSLDISEDVDTQENNQTTSLTRPTPSHRMAANSTNDQLLHYCSNYTIGTKISTASIALRTIVTVPLGSLVLYLGHQRWRQQRSFKTTSHSDVFTYNTAVLNLIWGLGCICYVCGTYGNLPTIVYVGMYATSLVFCGESLFHVLTCVERYLAVVHPITYMGLRNERGVRIRNISIACVWLMSFVMAGVTALYLPYLPIVPSVLLLVFSLAVVSFCSLSVLCVLIRPGPGEGGGEKQRVDRSKQRAFQTIIAILGVLGLWFVGLLASTILNASPQLSQSVGCVLLLSISFFNLPCSLMLPLLYLHRAGKLSCCCYNKE